MAIVAYSLLLFLLGWVAHSWLSGRWRWVKGAPKFNQDSRHYWLRSGGRTRAFTAEALQVAERRAYQLNDRPAGYRRRALWFLTFILLLVAVFLGGCVSQAASVSRVAVAPTGPATAEQLQAFRATIAELTVQLQTQRDLAQRAAAAVYGVRDANAHNPAGLPREAVDLQVSEAESALPAATPEAKLVKQAQNAKILAGQLEQVRTEMGQTITENEALRTQLTGAEKREADALRQLAKATADAEAERRTAAAKLQEQFDAMTARIAAAEEEARNKIANEQAAALNKWGAWLTGAGGLALALAGVFGGLAALRMVGPIAALAILAGMGCFGLAQIVSQWWFKWAVLSLVALAFVVSAWWVIRKYRAGTLAEAAAKKGEKFKGALTSIVPVLDDAYDNAAQDVKDLFDKLIFSKLSDERMDQEDKATIHELRAEIVNPKSTA